MTKKLSFKACTIIHWKSEKSELFLTQSCVVAPGIRGLIPANTSKHLPMLEYTAPSHIYFLLFL